MSETKVWSGWWWPSGIYPPPMAKENGPLDKFDQYIEKKMNQDPGTSQWELNHHYYPDCSWCGHCHGWAAAAILEPEPITSTARYSITFAVGDQKGLLTEVHCTDCLDLWKGWRDTMPPYEEDRLEAHVFHWILLNWVGNGEPVVMDIDKKPEVWNQPAYKVEMTSHRYMIDPKKIHVESNVWFARGYVPPDYVGLVSSQRSYKYWIRGDFKDPSEGGWEQDDHPGFIWHPDYVDTTTYGANPVVTYYHSHIEGLTRGRHVMIFAVPDLKSIAPINVIHHTDPDGPLTPLLFRGLVSLHGVQGHAVPAMAASWDVTERGCVYVFHIQDGAVFHDGTPVTAQDVAFTYNTLMNPDLGSPVCEPLREAINTVKVLTTNTVAFTLSHPINEFLTVHGWYWILSQQKAEEVGIEAVLANPMGSGPFALENAELDFLTLAAYSDYVFGKPLLDRIRVVEVADVDERLDFLAEGEADVALFAYNAEVEQRAQEMELNTFAIPEAAPRRLEIQSVKLKGRTPNEFDGAWNILTWDIDVGAPGPQPQTPEHGLVRRLIARGERRVPTDAAYSSEWREGVWWQVRVQQRAIAAGTPHPGWTLPFHFVFEIIGEDMVEDSLCYRIKVTYPDRPRSAEHKYAHLWVSKDEHIPVKGTLHIGDRSIPMQYDFLMNLVTIIPADLDRGERLHTVDDPRQPQEKVTLQAFEIHTSTGGKYLVSPNAPFPLQIEEQMYTVELQNWGN